MSSDKVKKQKTFDDVPVGEVVEHNGQRYRKIKTKRRLWSGGVNVLNLDTDLEEWVDLALLVYILVLDEFGNYDYDYYEDEFSVEEISDEVPVDTTRLNGGIVRDEPEVEVVEETVKPTPSFTPTVTPDLVEDTPKSDFSGSGGGYDGGGSSFDSGGFD